MFLGDFFAFLERLTMVTSDNADCTVEVYSNGH